MHDQRNARAAFVAGTFAHAQRMIRGRRHTATVVEAKITMVSIGQLEFVQFRRMRPTESSMLSIMAA
jgi:hypothetical protein